MRPQKDMHNDCYFHDYSVMIETIIALVNQISQDDAQESNDAVEDA